MKYAFAAIALAAVARAQFETIPECAITCLSDAIGSETDCAVTDLTCVCAEFTKIQGVATGCVVTACGAEVAVNEVLPAVSALCANPVAPSAGGSSSAEPTMAESTSAAEPTMDEPTTVPETTMTETSTVAETTMVETSTVAATTLMPSPTHGGNGTVTPTATVQPPLVSNAAGALGPIGGIALAAIGMFAL